MVISVPALCTLLIDFREAKIGEKRKGSTKSVSRTPA